MKKEITMSNNIPDIIIVNGKTWRVIGLRCVSAWAMTVELESVYGCHCDLNPGVEPDECVIDSGRHSECVFAKPGMRKELCRYWRAE